MGGAWNSRLRQISLDTFLNATLYRHQSEAVVHDPAGIARALQHLVIPEGFLIFADLVSLESPIGMSAEERTNEHGKARSIKTGPERGRWGNAVRVLPPRYRVSVPRVTASPHLPLSIEFPQDLRVWQARQLREL